MFYFEPSRRDDCVWRKCNTIRTGSFAKNVRIHLHRMITLIIHRQDVALRMHLIILAQATLLMISIE